MAKKGGVCNHKKYKYAGLLLEHVFLLFPNTLYLESWFTVIRLHPVYKFRVHK